MARKINGKGRKKIYYNAGTDTWVDDGKEQFALHPGQIADENMIKAEEELKKADDAKEELEEQKIDFDALLEEERIRNSRNRVTQEKIRRRMLKEGMKKKAEKIIEDGLGRDVSDKSFHDELYDDGVSSDEFIHEAAVDFKPELKEKEAIPIKDTDHDGDIDYDDEPTPSKAQRRMERYL